MRAIAHVGMMIFVFIALIAILFMVDAAYAQEVTEAVAAPTAVVTVEPLPAPEVPPVVVVPTPAPAISYESVLLFIGAVIAGLIWFANASNKRVQSSVPLELALTIADALVKLTPTATDDELLARLKTLLDKPAVPTPDEAVG